MKTFIDNSDLPITYSSVKTPLTIFQQGPIGVKDKMNWNGENVTQVEPFINAVDIDWNGANMGDEKLNTTTDLLNYIKKNISQSLGLLKLSEDLQDIPDKDNSIIIYKDGQWLYDELGDLENIQGGTSSVISKTYEELTNLIANNNLVPGQQYMITDYQATVSGVEGASATINSEFNIIVVADSKNTLNENARAVAKTLSTTVCKAWKLKYSINNDKSRFSWADENGGKGVIYYMKDEWNNECPYDFKNIKFRIGNESKFTYNDDLLGDASSYASCNNNIIRPFFETYTTIVDGNSITSYRQTLNFIVIESATSALNIVIDGNNRNLVFKGQGSNVIVSYGTNTENSIKEHTFDPDLINYWTVVGKKPSDNSNSIVVEVSLLDNVLPNMEEFNTLIANINNALTQLLEALPNLNIRDYIVELIQSHFLGDTAPVMGSTLTLSGDASIGGTLTVTGLTTLNGKLTVKNDAEITGNTTLGGNLTATSGTTTLDDTNINGNLTATSDTTLSDTNINGSLTVTNGENENTTINGNTIINGKLTVKNDAEISGDLKVDETVNTKNLTATNKITTQDFEATLDAEVDMYLNVGEKTTTQDLQVTGRALINDLTSNNIKTKKLEVTDVADINYLVAKTILSEDITTDYLTVNKSAHFFELIVDKIRSVYGTQINTAANCIVDFVEAYNATNEIVPLNSNNISYYRVYWRNSDGDGRTISNDWLPLDQALCESFNISTGTSYDVGNKYYWRKVIRTDEGTPQYVNLEKGVVSSNLPEFKIVFNYIRFKVGNTNYSFNLNSDIEGELTGYNWTPSSVSYGIEAIPRNSDLKNGTFQISTSDTTKLSIAIYYVDKTVEFFTSLEYNKNYSINVGNKVILSVKIYTKVIDKWYSCNWMDLSNTEMDRTNGKHSIPSAGDNLCLLGYRYNELLNPTQDDINRASAIIISSYKTPDSGVTPPSYALYLNITDFNLSSHRKSYFDATGAYFIGNFKVHSGSGDMDLDEYIRSLNTSEDTDEGIGIKVTQGEEHSRLDYIILQADENGNIYDINNFPSKLNIQITYNGEPILDSLYSGLSIEYLGKTLNILDSGASLSPTESGIYISNKAFQDGEYQVRFQYLSGPQAIDNSQLKILGRATINSLEYPVAYSIPISVVKSITGTDAEIWKLNKIVELARVNSSGVLLTYFKYGVLHIVGSNTTVVTSSEIIQSNNLKLKLSYFGPSDYNTPRETWEYNYVYYDKAWVESHEYSWLQMNPDERFTYIKAELYKGEYLVDSTIVNVTLESGYVFEVKDGLMQSYSALTLELTNFDTRISTLDQLYSSIAQSYSYIGGLVGRIQNQYDALTEDLQSIQNDYATFTMSANDIRASLTSTQQEFNDKYNALYALYSNLFMDVYRFKIDFRDEVNDITQKQASYEAGIDGFRAEIAEYKEGWTNITGNVYGILVDIGDIKGNLATYTQTVNSFIANFESPTGEFATYKNAVDGFESRIQTAEGEVASIRGDINSLVMKVNNTGIDIKNNVINLKAGKVNFLDSLGGTNGKISIDADTGALTAVDGNFSGVITATSGEFNGTVNATDGVFKGTINAGQAVFDGGTFNNITANNITAVTGVFKGELLGATGTFTGEINATSGNIGGFTLSGEGMLNSKLGRGNFISLENAEGKAYMGFSNTTTVDNFLQLNGGFYSGEFIAKSTDTNNVALIAKASKGARNVALLALATEKVREPAYNYALLGTGGIFTQGSVEGWGYQYYKLTDNGLEIPLYFEDSRSISTRIMIDADIEDKGQERNYCFLPKLSSVQSALCIPASTLFAVEITILGVCNNVNIFGRQNLTIDDPLYPYRRSPKFELDKMLDIDVGNVIKYLLVYNGGDVYLEGEGDYNAWLLFSNYYASPGN